jgi:hypothetical protein
VKYKGTFIVFLWKSLTNGSINYKTSAEIILRKSAAQTKKAKGRIAPAFDYPNTLHQFTYLAAFSQGGASFSQAFGAAFSQAAGAAFSQTAGLAFSQAGGVIFSQAFGAAFSQAFGAAFSQAFGAAFSQG